MITHTVITMATSIAILIPTVTPITILFVESLAVVDMLDVAKVVVNITTCCTEVIEFNVSLVD